MAVEILQEQRLSATRVAHVLRRRVELLLLPDSQELKSAGRSVLQDGSDHPVPDAKLSQRF